MTLLHPLTSVGFGDANLTFLHAGDPRADVANQPQLHLSYLRGCLQGKNCAASSRRARCVLTSIAASH